MAVADLTTEAKLSRADVDLELKEFAAMGRVKRALDADNNFTLR